MFALDRLNLMRKVEDYKTRGFEAEDLDNKLREVRALDDARDYVF